MRRVAVGLVLATATPMDGPTLAAASDLNPHLVEASGRKFWMWYTFDGIGIFLLPWTPHSGHPRLPPNPRHRPAGCPTVR